jgi:hypothetical protein
MSIFGIGHLRRPALKIRISCTSLIVIRTSCPWTNQQPRKAYTRIVCLISSSLFSLSLSLSLSSSVVEYTFLSSPHATTGSSVSLSLSGAKVVAALALAWRGASFLHGARWRRPRLRPGAVSPSSMVCGGTFLHGVRLLHGSRRLLP